MQRKEARSDVRLLGVACLTSEGGRTSQKGPLLQTMREQDFQEDSSGSWNIAHLDLHSPFSSHDFPPEDLDVCGAPLAAEEAAERLPLDDAAAAVAPAVDGAACSVLSFATATRDGHTSLM